MPSLTELTTRERSPMRQTKTRQQKAMELLRAIQTATPEQKARLLNLLRMMVAVKKSLEMIPPMKKPTQPGTRAIR